jgi:cobalamin biosynthesis Mg chelatase CobN
MVALAKKMGSILPVGKLKHMRNWLAACEYYAEGGRENLHNLFLFLLREYCGAKVEVRPPQRRPDYGIWWPPDRYFTDLKAFKSAAGWQAHRPAAGLFFFGGMHFDDCMPVVEALLEELRGELNLVPVFSRVEHNLAALRSFFFDAGCPAVDLIVNLQYFRLHGGPYGGAPDPTYRLLSELGVPVLIGFRSYTTELKEWQQENYRLSPLETTIGVMLPELDGCIEPVYVGGLKSIGKGELLEGELKEFRELPEGIKRMAGRIRKWLGLRHKPNAEKKLAVVLYDYPPGEANLGSAGYLDTLESLQIFLQRLAGTGYRVEVPAGDLGEFLLSRGVVNTPEWQSAPPGIAADLELYLRWYGELSPERREQVESCWGEPPGSIMAGKDRILIPGALLGNVFIGVQPSRGLHESPGKAYDDKKLPPHHQYLCFYWWLQKEFQADCIIHWGTHGTLEFTGGKEGPVSHRYFPDILIGDVPHLYYYWVGNPAESTIAKRQSYAVMVSHTSSPVTAAGLYGEYCELEELLAGHSKAEGEDKDTLALEIRAKVQALSLPVEDPAELEIYLYRMKRRLIQKGLHVLDRQLEGEDLIAYLAVLLRFEREVPSYYRIVAEKMGYHYENLPRKPQAFAAVEREVHQAIGRWLAGEATALPPEIGRYLEGVREKIARSRESAGLLAVLEGRYLLPNLAGDPLRSPEVYPAGGNMYEFDPRLIPTPLALKRGEAAVKAILEKFYRTHGHYPETAGIVLWGFETLSTGGETIAQLLAYLGVRLVRKENP